MITRARPIYCCFQDKDNPDIYWGIPTSTLGPCDSLKRTRIEQYCAYPERDIRSCYYHIGHTDRPAVFKVSNALPLTEKHIQQEYISQGVHLVLRNKDQIAAINRKLRRILFAENQRPNRYEQRMTTVYAYLEQELLIAQGLSEVATAAEHKKANNIVQE